MDMFLGVAAICVPAALFASVIKKDNPAIALMLVAAAGCLTLYSVLGALEDIISFLNDIASEGNVSSAVMAPLFKSLGIAFLSRFTSDICRDSGMTAAATAIETAGSAAIIYQALPVMKTVFQMIKGLVI